MTKTEIQWTDVVWNVVRGCSRKSTGCENCYAERQAHRFAGPGMPYEGLVKIRDGGPAWTGEVRFVHDKLVEPLRWRKPRRVFVNSMSDLFHEKVAFEDIAATFAVMAACRQHTFQILTKRPERAAEFHTWLTNGAGSRGRVWQSLFVHLRGTGAVPESRIDGRMVSPCPWPLPNVWLGTSAEDQATWDARVPQLLRVPAGLHWVSMEPLLEHVDPMLDRQTKDGSHVEWVVVGGESGPKSRPCQGTWIRNVVNQAYAARIPCFVKQLGAHYIDPENGIAGVQTKLPDPSVVRVRVLGHRSGGEPSEWPERMRVREYPEEKA